MAMSAVVAFDAHRLSLRDPMQMRPNLLAIGGEVVGAVQQNIPCLQALKQALERGSITMPAFPVNKPVRITIIGFPYPASIIFF